MILYIAVSIYLFSSIRSVCSFSLTPACIVTDSLTQRYPVTILNKLFSSVPKREKAINEITLNFGHCHGSEDGTTYKKNALILLVGRSASGKSTLLRIISQLEKPDSGTLMINGYKCFTDDGDGDDDDDAGGRNNICIPKPIIIDTKPDCFDSKSSVFQRLVDTIPDIPDIVSTPTIFPSNKNNGSSITKETIVAKFAQILGFKEDELYQLHPSDLTPSQQYLFGLTQGCIQSSVKGMKLYTESNITKFNDGEPSSSMHIPAPILLLDELLDKETSDVAKRVGKGLLNLTNHGGVVIAATHRPEYLMDVAERVVTLSSGKVLFAKHPR